MGLTRCFSETLLHEKKDIDKYEKLRKAYPYLTKQMLRTMIGVIQEQDCNEEVPSVRRMKYYLKEREEILRIENDDMCAEYMMLHSRRMFPTRFSLSTNNYRMVTGAKSNTNKNYPKLTRLLEAAIKNVGIEVLKYKSFADAEKDLKEKDIKYTVIPGIDNKNIKGMTIKSEDNPDGKPVIVLIGDSNKAETAIHEYTHMWVEAVKVKNPKLWKEVKASLTNMKDDTDVSSMNLKYLSIKGKKTTIKEANTWKEFKDGIENMYNPNNTERDEDYIASELLAYLTESIGMKELLNEEVQEKIENESDEKNLVKKLHEALRKFWKFVVYDILRLRKRVSDEINMKIENANDSANLVLSDLLNMTDLELDNNEKLNPVNIRIAYKPDNNIKNWKDYSFNVERQNGKQILYDENGNRIDIGSLDGNLKNLIRMHLEVANKNAVIVSVNQHDYIVNKGYGITDASTGERIYKQTKNITENIIEKASEKFKEKGINTLNVTEKNASIFSSMMNDMLTDIGSVKANELAEQIALRFSSTIDSLLNDLKQDKESLKKIGIDNLSNDIVKQRKQLMMSKAIPYIIAQTYEVVILNTSNGEQKNIEENIIKYSPMLMYLANTTIMKNEGISMFDRLNLFSDGFIKIGHNLSIEGLNNIDLSNGEKTESDSEWMNEIDDEAYAAIYEGWMDEPNERSIDESMSSITRRLFSCILNPDSKYFNGATRIVNENTVKERVLSIVKNCADPSEMMPRLAEAAKVTPWLGQLVDALGGRDTYCIKPYGAKKEREKKFISMMLQSTLWKDMHKAYSDMVYYKKIAGKETHANDKSASTITEVTSSVKSRKSRGVVVNIEDSFFDENGVYNAKYGKELRDLARKALITKSNTDAIDDDTIKALYNILTSMGYNIYFDALKLSIYNAKERFIKSSNEESERKDYILEMYDNVTSKILTFAKDQFNLYWEETAKGEYERIGKIKTVPINEEIESEHIVIKTNEKEGTKEVKIYINPNDTYYVNDFNNKYNNLVKETSRIYNQITGDRSEKHTSIPVDGQYKKLWNHANYNETHKIFDIILRRVKLIEKRYFSNWWYMRGEKDSFSRWLNKAYKKEWTPVMHQICAWKGQSFKKMSAKEYIRCRMGIFFDKKDRIMVPCMSDVSVKYTINIPEGEVISTREQFYDRMADIVEQELQRMAVVQQRKNYKDMKDTDRIEGFDKNGDMFYIIPELNDNTINVKDGNGKEKTVTIKEYLLDLYNNNKKDFKKQNVIDAIKDTLDDKIKEETDKLKEEGVISPVRIYNTNLDIEEEDRINLKLNQLKNYKDKEGAKKKEDYFKELINSINPMFGIFNITDSDLGITVKDVGYNVVLSSLGYNSDIDVIKKAISIIKELSEQYIMNEYFANIQCLELLFGDPAMCAHQSENHADLQKRIKQVYTPVRYCYNCHWMLSDPEKRGNYKLVQINDFTRKNEYSITLVDEIYDMTEKNAPNRDAMDVFGKLNKEKIITDEQYEMIESGLKDVNCTDGQTFRSAQSMNRLCCMIGDVMDIDVFDAVEKLVKGETLSKRELDMVRMEVKKLFVSSSAEINNPASTEKNSNTKTINVRVQHKNSDFTLMYAFAQIASFDYPKRLVGLSRFLEESGIDKANFQSVEKVGCTKGAINFSEKAVQEWFDMQKKEGRKIKEEDMYVEYLASKTGLNLNDMKDRTFNEKEVKLEDADKNLIRRIPFEDVGVSTDMSEYNDDVRKRAFGSQPQTMVIEDIPEDAVTELTVNTSMKSEEGNTVKEKKIKLTKDQVLKLYYKLITRDIMSKFDKVALKFKNAKECRDMIVDSMIRQGKADDLDLMYYLELDPTETYFVHSWLNPAVSEKFESILIAYMRKNIQKRTFRMDNLPQVSAFGYDENLACRFKDENGNMLLNKKEFESKLTEDDRQQDWLDEVLEKYRTYEEYRKEHLKKKMSILYFECAVSPYIFGSHLERFKGKNGNIDYYKLKNNLSSEAREFFGYRVPFEAKHSGIPCFIKEFLPIQNAEAIITPKEWIAVSDSDNDIDKLYCMFKELDSELSGTIDTTAFKIEGSGDRLVTFEDLYDSIDKNGIDANRNLLLSLVYNLMQTEYNTGRIFTPGGFVGLRNVANIMLAVENPNITDENLKEIISTENPPKNTLDVYSSYVQPSRQTELFKRNLIQKNLISIFAVERSFSFFEGMNNVIKRGVSAINLNGNRSLYKENDEDKIITLSNIKNALGQYCTDNMGENLGAAVDGVKFPLFSFLGVNEKNAPLVMFLERLGYDKLETALFVKLPVVQEIMNMKGDIGDHIKTLLNSVKFKDMHKKESVELTNMNMAFRIRRNKFGESNTVEDESIDYAALRMLNELHTSLEAYKKIITNNRSHTSSSLKSRSAFNISQIIKRDEANADMSSENSAIENASIFFDKLNMKDNDGDSKMNEIDLNRVPFYVTDDVMSTEQPFINAYYTYVFEGMKSLFSKYNVALPMKSGTIKLIKKASKMASKNGKKLYENEVNGLVDAVGMYFLSKLVYEENDNYLAMKMFLENELLAIVENVNAYIYNKNRREKVYGKALFDNLYVKREREREDEFGTISNPKAKKALLDVRAAMADHLYFKSTENFEALKCRNAWRELFQHGKEEIYEGSGITCSQFAELLIRYQIMRNGIRTSYLNNIINMFPKDCYVNLGGYNMMIESMKNFGEESPHIERILDQYVGHFYDDISYLPSFVSEIQVSSDDGIFNAEPYGIMQIEKSSNSSDSMYMKIKNKTSDFEVKYVCFYSNEKMMQDHFSGEYEYSKKWIIYKLISADDKSISLSPIYPIGKRYEDSGYQFGRTNVNTGIDTEEYVYDSKMVSGNVFEKEKNKSFVDLYNLYFDKFNSQYLVQMVIDKYGEEAVAGNAEIEDEVAEEIKRESSKKAASEAKELIRQKFGSDVVGIIEKELEKINTDETGQKLCAVK